MNSRISVALAACIVFFSVPWTLVGQSKTDKPIYTKSSAPIDDRVKDLLGRMTLEEKVAQLQCLSQDVESNNRISSNGIGSLATPLRQYFPLEGAEKNNRIQKLVADKTRLKIPVLIHDEGLHGLVAKAATSFPQAIGLASSFNTELMEKVASAIAQEARTRGIRQLLSPVINIARDVRWGRVEETYGEDSYLTSRMGAAFCHALEDGGVLSTPKHYVANVGDGGRDSYPIEFSERLLREVYFPPFQACFQEGHATSVMAAYNSLDGLPCSSNHWLLTDVLRNEWGFKGFVVSDYGSVGGIMDSHDNAATKEDAATQAINAGMDIELPSIYIFGEPLIAAVKDGKVSMTTLDLAVSRVLAAKFRLGLFEDPFVDPKTASTVNGSSEHRALALEAAREGIVLLKNEESVLPLRKTLKSIAVIGPRADAVNLGGYSGFGMEVITPLAGIKAAVSKTTKVTYDHGCELGVSTLPSIPSEYLVPEGAKPDEHGLKAEYFNNMTLAGQPVLVRTDKQVQFDWGPGSPDPKVNIDHFSVRWTGKLIAPETRKYQISVATDDGVRLYVDGKLLIDSWHDRGPSADLITLPMEKGKQYDLRIEYYENEGGSSASLGWEFKPETENNFQTAVDAARNAEVAVVVVGINEGEGQDRANLDLPGEQEKLINAVAGTGVPTVVVLVNGSAVTMGNWMNKVSAIAELWYGGEEGGHALADVLFGDYNPGGKLPITFPQFVGQVPLYYNHKPTGRGNDYVDMSGKPLFPFGYGLSYTKFEYSNLRIAPGAIATDGAVTIQVDVQNVGNRQGDEVVQLYIHDGPRSVVRPVKELKAFRRINFAANEKKTVSFNLTTSDLSFLNAQLKNVVEPGSVDVLVGGSSEDIRQKGKFEIRTP